jgi:hypothetical protein
MENKEINLDIEKENAEITFKNLGNKKEENSQDKINKPQELKEFNVLPHFKENIIHTDKNCKEAINEYSYYCFTCKHSVCGECGIYNHKDHLLIQRENCLTYDKTFFNEISKVIDDSISVQEKKNEIIQHISSSIESLKKQLDEIKDKKVEEINKIFESISSSLIDLKKNYLSVKESIENYYSQNEHFFNILGSENPNTDLENTVFLMNFEIMNLCDNKNLEVLDNIVQIKNKVNEYDESIKKRTDEIKNELDNYLNINYTFEKFDDFYWDIRLRTMKYSEQIQNFKNTISDIVKRTGSYDKIRDLLDIFDSKNKKGKDVIFNQEYFINDMGNDSTFRMKKIRGNSKNKLSSSRSGNLTLHKSKASFNQINKLLTSQSTINTGKDLQINSEDVILDNRLNQRFFAYSIYELFGKYFSNYANKDLNNQNNNYNNLNQSQNNQNNNINSKKLLNKKSNKNISKSPNKNNIINNITNNITNNNNNFQNNNINPNMSVSFLSNWTSRFTQLKEYAKPIIGSSNICLFDSNIKKLKRIPVKLTKEEHGYNVFPDGCRHILVDDILYITGGVDSIKNPLNIVLSFNINTFELKKLNNLNNNHSYHSIEYLDNYDCLIVIGGEFNSSCELFDIYSEKWIKIPDLNNPRANTNIYFDAITSDLYALFGMEGNIAEKNIYCDSIEVLELNDIKSGWIKVDYYKSADLNLKLNFCTVVPFTRDKLLIYGGNNSRVQKRLFALFDMSKNECMKVDTQTMEQIKMEEKKIKIVDSALSKIN